MTEQLTIQAGVMRLQFSQEELAGRSDVADLSHFDVNRDGRVVPLSGLLKECGASGEELVLTSSSDGFSATLPLEAASEVGLVWFAGKDGPLTKEQGGPFRFVIPNAAACKTDVLDACSNVKFVDRIEVR